MKHPALVRVFAVVLTIMCFVMTGAGVLGLNKTENDYNDNMQSIEKMRSDIEEYKELLVANEGKETYKESSEALSQQKEEHDKLSAEHRTELATYSATKGGVETGMDALNTAWVQLQEGKAQFEAGKKEFEAQKAAFMEMYNGYYMAVQYLPMMEEQANNLQVIVDSVDPAIPAAMKQELEKKKEDLKLEEAELLAADPEKTQTEAWALLEEKKLKFKEEEDLFNAQFGPYYQAVAGLAALQEQMAPMKMLLAATSPEQLEEGKKGIDAAEAQLAEAQNQIYAAGDVLDDNFNKLWAEKAKLADKEIELAETKDKLLVEAEEISEKETITEEQKQREKRIKSLYLTFMDKAEIAEAVENGQGFVEAVEEYIADFEQQSIEDAKYRGLANVFMAVSVLAAILLVISSFELIKKFTAVRAETFMIFMLAAAAMGIFLWLGRGVSYSAMGVLIFAFIQFLVSGKVKRKA